MGMMAEHIDYYLVSKGGKISPNEYGYYIVPLYNPNARKSSISIEIWIAHNIDGLWTRFDFHGGTSYCFYRELDAMAFKLAWV